MKTTDELSREHQAILKGLDILKGAAASWRKYEPGAAEDCRALVEFFKMFADHCHHGKEEKVLFPKLMQAGIRVRGGPLGIMLQEHDQGRELIGGMEQALDRTLPAQFEFYANRYAQLLSEHITKEDNVLFKSAEGVMNGEEDDAMVDRFDEIEREMGEDTHERFHQMLDRLASRYPPRPAKAS